MKLVIIGNGGHSKVVQEIAKLINYQIIAILDDQFSCEFFTDEIVYGPTILLRELIDNDVKVVVAIGNNSIRKKMTESFHMFPDQYATLIHPTATISKHATIGYGTVIMPNTVINPSATIGDHCIINSGAIVEHDNRIESFAHISPTATLTGNVSVGEGTQIGASATIIPGIKIGKWSVVGAGSTVIKNIPSYCKVVGSPTRVIEYKEIPID